MKLRSGLISVEAALGFGQAAQDFAESFFASFIDAVAPVMVGVQNVVEPTDLLRRYFAADPPFGGKETKKHEFPDAMALISLEAWARAARTMMLVISRDSG
jgi:PIN domain